MQGEKTEESVIAALEKIYLHADCFDVVVIIRGGGATSDLSSFDSYLLAANCAQFPLPILTGIGHERDDTVVDLVAHTRMKTPTAVAEFLIGRTEDAAAELLGLQQAAGSLATQLLAREKNYLQLAASRLPSLVQSRIERSRSSLQMLTANLPAWAGNLTGRGRSDVQRLQMRLAAGAKAATAAEKRRLELTEQFVKMASPDYILQRGYSLALQEGKIVKQAASLRPGELLTTRFADGEVESVIKKRTVTTGE